MWWRVARRAPLQADQEDGQPSRYAIWRDRVSDGFEIDRPHDPEFTFGRMDSVQLGFVVSRNKFCSCFREDDDDFRGETWDGSNPETEMLWDDVFYPGTQIEYFFTTNWVPSPDQFYYLPDTSGAYFFEVEILPGLRTAHVPDCGGFGFDYCVIHPSTLYIDGYSRGAQVFIENALRTVLNGLPLCEDPNGCEIPDDRLWDRYDYQRAPCCYNIPFARGAIPGSINGMTLNQIIGYRAILLNTGTSYSAPTHDEDFVLFDEWLTTSLCNGNANRQVFLFNGDRLGEVVEYDPNGALFLNQTLGATMYCSAFHGGAPEMPECGEPNDSYCVGLIPAAGGPYGTEFDIDAYGNSCPLVYSFNVYDATNGGVGNRYYSAEDGLKDMEYSAVTREDLSADANYRGVASSPSWHHMTRRNPEGSGSLRCPADLPSITAAIAAEIGAGLRWGFDVPDNESIPKYANAHELMDCQGTGNLPSGVDNGQAGLRVNRLYQNRPNPFNPITTIQFSLAHNGPVEIVIYDVSGRRVKTLADKKMEAGVHALVWDGSNDEGRPVGSGIYWSQMRTGAYQSKKKMVVLK
jgi:hypothetical protein